MNGCASGDDTGLSVHSTGSLLGYRQSGSNLDPGRIQFGLEMQNQKSSGTCAGSVKLKLFIMFKTNL